jgi:hypothetical protein
MTKEKNGVNQTYLKNDYPAIPKYPKYSIGGINSMVSKTHCQE